MKWEYLGRTSDQADNNKSVLASSCSSRDSRARPILKVRAAESHFRVNACHRGGGALLNKRTSLQAGHSVHLESTSCKNNNLVTKGKRVRKE